MPIGPALTPNTLSWWLKPPSTSPWFGRRFQLHWRKHKLLPKTLICLCRRCPHGLTNCASPEVKARPQHPLSLSAKPKQKPPLNPAKSLCKSPACCCNLKKKWPWGTAKPCQAQPLCCAPRSKPKVCNSILSLPSRCKPPWLLPLNSKVGNASALTKFAFNWSPKQKHCCKHLLLRQQPLKLPTPKNCR